MSTASDARPCDAPARPQTGTLKAIVAEAFTPSRIVEAAALGAAVAVVTVIVVMTGGAPNPLMHLYYIPIFVAALHCGAYGGAATGLVAGLAGGPLMISSTPDLDTQPLWDWVVRLVMFAGIGLVAGWLARQEPRPVTELLGDLRASVALRRAISRREISVHFQPLIRVSDGAVVGAEALARWTDHHGVSIPPSAFIPLAERKGLIGALGALVLDQAMDEAHTWPASTGQTPLLTVNVSAIELGQSCFVDNLRGKLDDPRPRDFNVCVELTESAMLHNRVDAISRLGAIREAGLRVAIDDFGTGQSALSYLAGMPVDVIKIDQSFVEFIDMDPRAMEMVRLIVQIARSLDTQVLAEGVERPEQAATLRDLGCDLLQGYYFGRPAPAADLDWTPRAMPARAKPVHRSSAAS